MLFQFAVTYQEPAFLNEAGERMRDDPKLVAYSAEPFWAKSESEASGVAWRAVPDEYMDKRVGITIEVRPFR